MIKPEIPTNENERLEVLKSYSILDTLPEKEYDDITYLASHICQVPISLITLIDNKRQWFKSHYGLNVDQTPREVSFCAHAINDQENILIVPDSRNDERFRDNPLVTDEPYVIFYVGVPLVTSEGYPLGTLCIIDNKPNELKHNQLEALKALSNQLMKIFESRINYAALQISVYELEAQNKSLHEFARIAAHDLKSPLNSITMATGLLENSHSGNIGDEGVELLEFINQSSEKLATLIDGILQYCKNSRLLEEKKETIDLLQNIQEVTYLADVKKETLFDIKIKDGTKLYTNKVAFNQVLINLLSNAIRYNDKNRAEIIIQVADTADYVKFNVVDNGPGINKEDQKRIFKIFETNSSADKFGAHGTGIGLATVKSLIEGLGGTISVSSELGKGTNFEFTIKK